MELVEAGEVDEADGAEMRLEAAEGGAGFDVEDLDKAGEVGGGQEAGVGAEGGAGDGVGEGGDGGSGGEGLGAVKSEGGGVCGGEGVRGCGGEGEGGDGDEVGDLLGLEGGPVLGFRGLLRGSGFRFQLWLHREILQNSCFLHFCNLPRRKPRFRV